MDLASLISFLRECYAKINSGQADIWVILDMLSVVLQFVLRFKPSSSDGKILFGSEISSDPILEGQLVSICGDICSALDQEDGATAPVFQGVLIDQIGAAAIAALVKALQSWLAANGIESILDALQKLLAKSE